MKNITKNGEMISISDLKKQAKILRKKNNTIRNHSQSLKALANQYNYDSWENLLDDSYIMVNKKNQTFKKEQIHWHNNELLVSLSSITSIMVSMHNEYEYLNSQSGYNALFNFFQTNLLVHYNAYSPEIKKMKLLIDFMITAYLECKKTNTSLEFKEILNFAYFDLRNYYFNSKLSPTLSLKLKTYTDFSKIYMREQIINDIDRMENGHLHLDILLEITSISEKIEIMSMVYEIIRRNTSSNQLMNNWLTDYENFIKLSHYDNHIAKHIHDYQTTMRIHTSSFFSIEKHKEALMYLNKYSNQQYDVVKLFGTRNEVISKAENLSLDPNCDCEYDMDKAMDMPSGQYFNTEDDTFNTYEFLFYYIIH